MNDWIAAGLGKEFLQPRLDRVLVERLLVGLFGRVGEQHAPKTAAVVAGDLEQRAPFVRIGKIVAGALRDIRCRRRRSWSAPGSARDGYSLRTRCRAPCARSSGPRRRRSDMIRRSSACRARPRPRPRRGRRLPQRVTRAENSTLAWERARSRSIAMFGELVLLALHDEGKARVVFQHAEIEFGDHLAAGAVPDAKLRLDQTAPDDFLDQPSPASISSVAACVVAARGMSLTRAVRLEHMHRDPLARERQAR